jgi:hypothetical protein
MKPTAQDHQLEPEPASGHSARDSPLQLRSYSGNDL